MLPPPHIAQDPEPSAPGSLGSWLWSLGREPGVVEVLLAAAVVATVLVAWWRLARLVQHARARAALADYLLGVEQALHGDLDAAHDRLRRVLEQDPENHVARLLLGKVLTARGEAEQAHQQHLCLQRAFEVQSPDNDLLLAESLLAAGLPLEAAETAERALQSRPRHAPGWDLAYRARLQGGDLDGAMRTGRRLLELLEPGAQRQLRSDLARVFATAATLQWRRGVPDGARRDAERARRLDPGHPALPLLDARLEAAAQGVAAVASRLLAAPDGGNNAPRALVPIATAAAMPRPEPSFAGLLDPERWSCRACGTPLSREMGTCPRCRAVDPAELVEPGLTTAIEAPLEVMDRIDANDAHLERLIRQLEGNEGARNAALAELLELRERAVMGLLRAAWRRSGPDQERMLDVLRAMGPAIVPALFGASDDLARERLLPVGQRSPAALVGRVVQGFDRAALPHVEALFTSARPDHRKILIDYFLGLADLEQFQLVLERFPPMEILNRLNHADNEVLRRFLQAVPRGHFVAEALLLEPTFYRDEALISALPGAADAEVLFGVLSRRGPTRAATKALLGAIDDPVLGPSAERVLIGYGDAVLDHVLAAYADPERPAEARARLGALLVRGGEAAAARVADSFGPEPGALDDELRRVLVGIGDRAVDALTVAYERTGWIEKFAAALVSRHTNRRVQIVLALGELGTAAAVRALRQLHAAERDANLRLRIEHCLHELGDQPAGDRGEDDAPDR